MSLANEIRGQSGLEEFALIWSNSSGRKFALEDSDGQQTTWVQKGFLHEEEHGDVYRIRCIEGHQEGETWALKRFRMGISRRAIINELTAIESLSRDLGCVVYCHGWFFSNRTLNLLMEECKDGSLDEWSSQGNAFDEDGVQAIALNIIEGIAEIHANGYVHGALDLDNLLLVDHPIDHGSIKFADFGRSRYYGPGRVHQAGMVDMRGFVHMVVELLTDEDWHGDLESFLRSHDISPAGIDFIISVHDGTLDAHEAMRHRWLNGARDWDEYDNNEDGCDGGWNYNEENEDKNEYEEDSFGYYYEVY